jgi:hypothetical protein
MKDKIDWTATAKVVWIDWEGRRPNGSFYAALHREGIIYRAGDWETEKKMRDEFPSPLARRNALSGGHGKAIPAGMGIYLCKSDDIARLIIKAAMDQPVPPGAIQMGEMRLVDAHLSERDLRVYDEYQHKAQAARKNEDAGVYTLTCLNEAITYSVNVQSLPLSCVYCGDITNLTVRQGGLRTYTAEPVEDAWTFWLRTRFGYDGTFEIPRLVAPGKSRRVAEVVPSRPSVAMEMFDLRVAQDVLDHIAYRNLWLDVWDALYFLSLRSPLERNKGRLKVLTPYIYKGGTGWMSSMAAPQDGYDLVDLCVFRNKEFYKFL